MKTSLLSIILLGIFFNAQAQYADITWQKTYDIDSPNFSAFTFFKSSDSDFVFAGKRYISDGFSIMKVKDTGSVVWLKTYSRPDYVLRLNDCNTTNDGGYIATGVIDHAAYNPATSKLLVLRFDDTGAIVWEKQYHPLTFIGERISQTADNGYILGCDVGGSNNNIGVYKLDPLGDTVWHKTYGGSNEDWLSDIRQTSDGNYLILCQTWSQDGDISFNHGAIDLWLLKLNASGNIIWERCYGGSGSEKAASVIECTDGSYMISGTTNSNDGDVGSIHSTASDAWLVKLDTAGNIIWEMSYGGYTADALISMKETAPGQFTILAYSYIYTTADIGDQLCAGIGSWLFTVDNIGTIIWQKQYHSDGDVGFEKTVDGGYLTGGIQSLTIQSSMPVLTRFDLSSVLICDSALSVPEQEIEGNNILVYPTVTNGELFVKFTSGHQNSEIQLFDMVGREVRIQAQYLDKQTLKLNINELPPSLYLLTVTDKNKKTTFKIIYQP